MDLETNEREFKKLLTTIINNNRKPNADEIANVKKYLSHILSERRCNILAEVQSDTGMNVLHKLLVKHGNPHAVLAILETLSLNEQTELLRKKNHKGCSSIHFAAQHGYSHFLNSVLEPIPQEAYEALVMAQDNDGHTPIAWAAKRNHSKTAHCLLEIAKPEFIEELLKISDKNGQTPFHLAAGKGHTETMRSLLDSLAEGARHEALTITDNWGCTALHCSAWKGHAGTTRCILELVPGRSLELMRMTQNDGLTPLELAQHKNRTETIEVLLKWENSDAEPGINFIIVIVIAIAVVAIIIMIIMMMIKIIKKFSND